MQNLKSKSKKVSNRKCARALRPEKKGHIFGTLAKENMDTFMFTESIVGKPTEWQAWKVILREGSLWFCDSHKAVHSLYTYSLCPWITKFCPKNGYASTPTPWLTLLLVLGSKRVITRFHVNFGLTWTDISTYCGVSSVPFPFWFPFQLHYELVSSGISSQSVQKIFWYDMLST